MTADISIVGTITALVLPMLLGGVWVYWLLGRTERWHPALVAGHGYLVGMFAITLLIRAWDLAGLALNFWGIAAIAAVLTTLGIALIRARPVTARAEGTSGPIPAWQIALIFALAALLTWRYSTIFQELLLRPLYPWDAWMNWAPKAVVWYHYSELAPFADMNTWLAAPAEALTHIEGARNAWRYPAGVPLIQLWGMLGAGTSDHTVIYLPWILISLAMGAALYGHLRLQGASILLAVTAVYVLLNMPFVNVHSTLAGYADLWVAVAFGSAIFSLQEWHARRDWTYGCLALVLAVFCAQLKTPGIIMCGIVGLTMLLGRLQLRRNTLLGLVTLGGIVSLLVLLVGIDMDVPAIGRVTINAEKITIPYIGDFEIAFHNVNQAIVRVLFDMINWNIHWYVLIAMGTLLAFRPRLATGRETEITALVITLAFLFFVYYFTERSEFARDFTQVNRALLYSIPVSVLLVFGVLHNGLSGVLARVGAKVGVGEDR